MKILVISLAGIGDTLIATPMIHELRLQFPDAVIDALVLWAGAKDLLAGNPWLNTVHQHNFLQLGRLATIRRLFSLRRLRYDVSINAHPQSKIHYRIAACLIGAPRRLSHRYDNCGRLDRWLVNCSLPQDYSVHSADNNFRLLRLLNPQAQPSVHSLELFFNPRELAAAEAQAAALKHASRRLLGVHTGSGRTKNLALKRWPIDHWTVLLRRVLARWTDCTVVLFGGPDEQADNTRLLRDIADPRLVAPPTRSIREAAALLRHCDAFLSVDNALMHCAAAVQVPRHVLIESPTFGPTLEPYRRPYTLVPNPAVHGRNLEFYRYDGRGIRGSRRELLRCMRAVTPEAVFDTLARVLAD
ncbi:MAG: glycosyltransferase family 9 protein [Verrucomicrobia bacterium]|nr:glycosyltransferase family 9 protein [Verrucomicrobiota bacterium]